MASYKQACIQCGALIERDSRYCLSCGSMNAFGYHCPTCMKEIQKGQQLCSDCGRGLYVTCPRCGGKTFAQDKCEICGGSLMIRCQNSRCDAPQFFENTKCTACGKKIKRRKLI